MAAAKVSLTATKPWVSATKSDAGTSTVGGGKGIIDGARSSVRDREGDVSSGSALGTAAKRWGQR
eukprot:6193569-Pleurochrysis_carterae.AAC.2